MINYFKHTTGESFTLDGENYIGFFHILDGKAFTGKTFTIDSRELAAKSTMLSELYLQSDNLDTNYGNIPTISRYYSNTFDLLNKQGLISYISPLDANNLICFKSLILGNPTIFTYNAGCRYYGLVSSQEDSSASVPYKTDYSGHISPFSVSNYWGFLDKITTGVVLVDTSENFKYVCSDGENDYILNGTFTTDDPLTLSYTKPNLFFDITSPDHNRPNFTYSIHHDVDNSKFLFVKLSAIEIYDATTYGDCNNLILIDKIALAPTIFKWNKWNTFDEAPNITAEIWNSKYRIYNPISPKFIKFGKNLRSYVDGTTLQLFNKYSTEIYRSLDMPTYGIDNILAVDIRTVDDYVVILHGTDQLKVSFFDPSESDIVVTTKDVLNIQSNDSIQIQFSDMDSNVFYIQTPTEYHARYITVPAYPSGRLDQCAFPYPYRAIWNTTIETYNRIPQQWNTSSIKSNYYNNLVSAHAFANNKMYMIHHNIGRIFALQQPADDRYYNFIPLDLVKYQDSVECSQSSLGVYLNSELSNIVKDISNIYANAFSSFTLSETGVKPTPLNVIPTSSKNLNIQGNETLNVIALQRISTNITNLQSSLLPSD